MPSNVAPEPQGTTAVPLLKFESGMFGLMGEGITTITFFSGDCAKGVDFLKERLRVVAKANPWICGTIELKHKGTKLAALRFQSDSPPDVSNIFEKNDKLQLSDQMPYVELAKAVNKSSAQLPAGKKLAKAGTPVSKLTVTPCSSDGFAVIFSMSHMIANGGTYYMILNMLSGEAKVTPLNPERKQAMSDRVPEYVGAKHYKYMTASVPNVLNSVGSLIRGKKVTSHCFLVDEEKLSIAKKEAESQGCALPEGVHVSTNDVITSGFGKVMKPRLLTMAMDFKGRIEGLSREDAGNYHAGIILDPDSYAEPSIIRQAVTGPPPCSRAALPGCCTAMRCRLAIITSWAGFKGIEIPECKQTMHCPAVDISGMVAKAQDSLCIVFNPTPGKTAILCCVKSVKAKDIMAGLPLAGPLSAKMWPMHD